MNDDIKEKAEVDIAFDAYVLGELGDNTSTRLWQAGFYTGLQMAMASPEWAQGFLANSNFPPMPDELTDQIAKAVPIEAR